MAIFDIESLGPTEGPCPTNHYDAERSLSVIAWKPGDEAVCTFRIPYGITAGPIITLSFDEIAPGPGFVYSWDIRVAALRPGETESPVPASVIISQFTTTEPAGSVVIRSIPDLAPNGRVGEIELTAGAILSLGLKLSSAPPGPCPGKLLTLAYRIEIAVDSHTDSPDCAGRVANIIREARDLFNEETGAFLSDGFILRSINACMKDLALEDYWIAEKSVPISAGREVIDLIQAIPDLRKVLRARFDGQPRTLTALQSLDSYLELTSNGRKLGTPEYYLIQNNMMRLWPIPSTDSEAGFHVYYSQLPPPLGCAESNCEPPAPQAHDTMFTLFALRQAFLRDRNAVGADLKFREYSQLYEIEKKRLLDGREPAHACVRPR